MLTKLHLKNFKSWKDTGSIRLAPITVFFGTNSSGKSSLVQFLRMLRQTMDSPDRRRVLHLGDASTDIDLGTFADVVHQHDLAQQIEFALEWRLSRPLTVIDDNRAQDAQVKRAGQYTGTDVRFGASVGRSDDGISVDSFNYELLAEDAVVLDARINRTDHAAQYRLDSDTYSFKRSLGRKWPLGRPQRFYGFPQETVPYYQNAEIVSDLELAIETQLGRLQYLGPLRATPQRTYVWGEERPESVGFTGENAVAAMLAARNRSIQPRKGTRSKGFDAVIAQWLHTLGVVSEFKVRQIGEGRREYEVLVKVAKSSPWVALTDVGFGISQVLPVLVECFYVAPGSTIIMEQPEIHLHPAAQVGLADLFIQAIRAREDGADRNIQLLIESHSEHFLRRLQRRIAEQEIDPADVAMYFCRTERDGSRIEELKIDRYGMIENWPEAFFGDMLGETAAQMRMGLARRASEAGG